MIRRTSILWRMDTGAEVVRLWSGDGELELPSDAVETSGGVYRSLPPLLGMPGLSALVGAIAERVEFSISGVSDLAYRLAGADAATVRDAKVDVGTVDFDAAWQIAGVFWEWGGTADSPVLSRQPGDEDRPVVKTMGLSVGSTFTRRVHPNPAYFTGVEQRRRSPTDAFCDLAATYSNVSTVRWPA